MLSPKQQIWWIVRVDSRQSLGASQSAGSGLLQNSLDKKSRGGARVFEITGVPVLPQMPFDKDAQRGHTFTQRSWRCSLESHQSQKLSSLTGKSEGNLQAAYAPCRTLLGHENRERKPLRTHQCYFSESWSGKLASCLLASATLCHTIWFCGDNDKFNQSSVIFKMCETEIV